MKINIGQLLKSIALSALGAGVTAAVSKGDEEVPGSHLFISGVGKLLDKNDSNNQQGVDEIKQGFVLAVQSIDPTRVQDMIELEAALTDAKQVFDRIKAALKP